MSRSADHEALREAVRRLRAPVSIRERCANITAAVAAGKSAHFSLQREQLTEVARRVARLTRQRFPGAVVPPHSHWRNLEAGGRNRKALLDGRLAGRDRKEMARARIDLIMVSILLDADAGSDWRYLEASSGQRFARSEGQALAAFHAFLAGRFSSDPGNPLQADAQALEQIDTATLAQIFQVSPDNPLPGLEQRATLLRRLGAAMRARPEAFPPPIRPGQLFDLVSTATVRRDEGMPREHVTVDRVGAPHLLRVLLKAFSVIWSGGQTLGGHAIGDVWPHPEAGGEGLDAGRVPFHKLSQWLSYSMIEPLEWAGIKVDRLDELTGLPDYRNGGLFIDAEVIVPRDPQYAQRVYMLSDPWVIEWRALTVSLLDEVMWMVRTELGEPKLPLAAVLEGGTWAAGREIAAERRTGGPPPVKVASQGSMF